ncbi:MAG: GTP-binding protein [Promethearchaeati archaeon SRVP18_Atabeyarchaeia-1]
MFKVIAVGDGSVGKTSITIRFCEGKFSQEYLMTIGANFGVKQQTISFGEDAKDIKLQIWDTGGQERFSAIRELYYKGALGALVVFDVTNRESFEHVPTWFSEVRRNITNIPITLIGNKIDLPSRAVTLEEGVAMSKRMATPYRETSAKTGERVYEVFSELSYRILLSLYGPPIVNGETIIGIPKELQRHSASVESEK